MTKSRAIVLYAEEEGEHVSAYAEGTVASLDKNGGLMISHQFWSPDNKRWQSWQNSGTSVGSDGVAKLKEFLNE